MTINLKDFENHLKECEKNGDPYKIVEGFDNCIVCQKEQLHVKLFSHGYEAWCFCMECGSWLWII